MRIADDVVHGRHAGSDQCVRAGWGASHMRARFEGDHGGRTSRRSPCLLQRHDLGMWPTDGLGGALADDAALHHDHTAHRRVRCGGPSDAASQFERTLDGITQAWGSVDWRAGHLSLERSGGVARGVPQDRAGMTG
jgi:hypothetical protein